MGIQVGNAISLEVFFAACVANFFPKTACLQLLNLTVKKCQLSDRLTLALQLCSCDALVAMPTLNKDSKRWKECHG